MTELAPSQSTQQTDQVSEQTTAQEQSTSVGTTQASSAAAKPADSQSAGAQPERGPGATEETREVVSLTQESISKVNADVLPTLLDSEEIKSMISENPEIMGFLLKIIDAFYPQLGGLSNRFSDLLNPEQTERTTDLKFNMPVFKITEVLQKLNENTLLRAVSLKKPKTSHQNLTVLTLNDDNLFEKAKPIINHLKESRNADLLFVEGENTSENQQIKILRELLLGQATGLGKSNYNDFINLKSLHGIEVSKFLTKTNFDNFITSAARTEEQSTTTSATTADGTTADGAPATTAIKSPAATAATKPDGTTATPATPPDGAQPTTPTTTASE